MNWKPRFRQDESETCCFETEESFVLSVVLGNLCPSLHSLPFSEFDRF